MGMAVPTYYTADMVPYMPNDGNRYEVVYGKLLVTPALRPWHQILVGRLSLAIGNYLRRHPAGVVLASPADISWGPDALVQPDVFVVSTQEARTLTLEPDTHAAPGRRSAQSIHGAKRPVSQAAALPRGGSAGLLGRERRGADGRDLDSIRRVPRAIERERLAWHPQGLPRRSCCH